jgi:HNH endonuclease
MVKRFAERRSKKGRIIQIGRQVPFTLDEFRAWLITKLGGDGGGVIKCRYCAEWLTMDTLVVDHATPTSQGGSLDFDNLDVICAADNQRKGGMCAECYQSLLDWSCGGNTQIINGLHPACRENMLQRMQSAVSLGAWQRREMARQAKAQPKQEEEEF